ncbi:DsbA family protein [Agarivorans sp.]|uniref:DsbA family protein n=1 Tax=Agarivorans sp. TaxID=1872412 RepID=UPI003D02DDF4
MIKVHYIFDPMCGWCYGASSLLSQLQEMDDIGLELHPGGMIQRAPLSADFRQHVLVADQQIAIQTGQAFGEDYLKKIRSNQPMILDSYITAQAILAVASLGLAPMAMLQLIQEAHYQYGVAVSQPEELAKLASQLGVSLATWQGAMAEAKTQLEPKINRTRALMQQFGLSGFPSLLVEQDGQWRSLGLSEFYTKPAQWQQFWQVQLASS